MEDNEGISFALPQITPTPMGETVENPIKEKIENKKSLIISLDENTEYILTIKQIDGIIYLVLSQNIDENYYENCYNLIKLQQILKMGDISDTNSFNEIFDEIQKSILNKKPIITLMDNKLELKLFLKDGNDFSEFELNKKELEMKEILLNLMAELKLLKEKVKILTKDNISLNNKIELLEDQNKNKQKCIEFRKDLISSTNSGTFAVFNSKKDNKTYLATGNKITYEIDLYFFDLNNMLLSKSLKGHNQKILLIDYYYNNKNQNEYLCSVDKNCILIVWNLNFDTSVIINTGYCNAKVYKSLILFNIYNMDYVITGSTNENDFTKVFYLHNGQLIKNVSFTNENITYFLIQWFYNNNNYIIELCENKFCTYDLLRDEIYFITEPKKSSFYTNGFIYNRKFLCTCPLTEFIEIWDLVNKNLSKNIKIEGHSLSDVIQFDQQYLICADSLGNFLILVDYLNNRIVEIVDAKHEKKNDTIKGRVASIKKFESKILGDYLLTTGTDNYIKLWNFNKNNIN